MKAIFEREFKSLFRSITGWLFIAFLMLFVGIYTLAYNLNYAYANFEYVLSGMAFIFMIIIPVLTMKGFAEERHQKTDLLLYSLPIRLSEAVMGKYFAMLAVLAIPMGITALYPLILSAFGTINFATAYGALLAFFLMGAAFIAIGLFVSSLTESQVIAAVICFLLLLVNFFLSSIVDFLPEGAAASFLAFTAAIIALAAIVWLLTRNRALPLIIFAVLELALAAVLIFSSATLEGLFPDIVSNLSLFSRFDTFVDGVFDLTAIVFYIAVAFIFLFLTDQSLEKRRWN